jgi:hypothetical protein
VDELTEALRRALSDPRRALPVEGDPLPAVHRGIRRRRARRSAAAGASLALVVVAAGSALALVPADDRGSERQADDRTVLQTTPSPRPTAEVSPEPDPSPQPGTSPSPGRAFAADTEPDVGGPARPGNGLSVVDARVGRQDGFDRVVYELAGEGEVGWRVEYVDEPRQQGSGDEVDLEGESSLSVTVLGVGYPGDTGIEHDDGPRRLRDPTLASVAEVFLGSVFEGHYESFLGISGPPRPFRVYALSNPTRLVIDVRDG